jgi:hypothetical protein
MFYRRELARKEQEIDARLKGLERRKEVSHDTICSCLFLALCLTALAQKKLCELSKTRVLHITHFAACVFQDHHIRHRFARQWLVWACECIFCSGCSQCAHKEIVCLILFSSLLQHEQKECESLQLALSAARQDCADLERIQQTRDSTLPSVSCNFTACCLSWPQLFHFNLEWMIFLLSNAPKTKYWAHTHK